MTIYQIFALLFLVATPFVAILLTKLLYLHIWGIRWTDLALWLFAAELVLVSQRFLVHNLLPHYLLLMSILAIGVAVYLIRQKTPFTTGNFIKTFGQVGFYATTASYVVLLVAIFLQG
ncbi:DUF3397 family protein [Streptococcus pluranimalium]|uniref:DUF3397 family protein n=1 Tax=Streptococcus pluranimalium TaxID=82348 RepID=UPI0040469298